MTKQIPKEEKEYLIAWGQWVVFKEEHGLYDNFHLKEGETKEEYQKEMKEKYNALAKRCL